MNRAEHLQWCKDRALAYCSAGDWKQAWASMASDMRKHPETENHIAIELGMRLMLAGHMNTVDSVKEFVLGFN